MGMIDILAAKSDHSSPELWLSFKTHMLDTAAIIRQLFDRWLPESVRNLLADSLRLDSEPDTAGDHASDFCRLIALLHDIGKLTPAFQSKIADRLPGYRERLSACQIELSMIRDPKSSPHALAGEAILTDFGFPQEICEVVGFHHGAHHGDAETQIEDHASNYYGYRNCNRRTWRSLWKEWVQFALDETGFTIRQLPHLNVPTQMLLTGLLIMADWIASNADYFPYVPIGKELSDADCSDRADAAWKRLSLPDLWRADACGADAEWFYNRFGFEANEIQEAIMEQADANPATGIYILEAPMGMGKTEAALAAAEILADRLGLGGIYFGLPTQATANGVFGRIHSWATQCDNETHSIRLAHGMTELNDEYRSIFHGKASDSGDESVIVHEWFEGRKQALLSDFVVATVDQFLLASLKQRHVMLRHLGLAGKAVIIDECHAYDAYMNVYLDRALRWMGEYGVPVIILSATLPIQRREALIRAYLGACNPRQAVSGSLAYPLLTWSSCGQVLHKEIAIEQSQKQICIERLTETELADALSFRLSEGGCAAVIVNSVKYAQELSMQLTAALPGFEVVCFHSRFLATDRAEIEKKLLHRVGKHSQQAERDHLIVVGTQVLEQSLDLDFDYMVSALCPMDLLLQRSGRLHRHERRRPRNLQDAVLSILEPKKETPSVYDAWILQQTASHLPKMLDIPSCIPVLVNGVYSAADETDPLYLSYCRKIAEKEEKAKNYCINSDKLREKYVNCLSDLLNDDVGSQPGAEASVRDLDETVEVILLCEKETGKYALISGEAEFDTTYPLQEFEAIRIARERLRLPASFSRSYRFNETINALTPLPPAWKLSKWLSRELLLLLSPDEDTAFCGAILRYSRKYGLLVRRADETWTENLT